MLHDYLGNLTKANAPENREIPYSASATNLGICMDSMLS